MNRFDLTPSSQITYVGHATLLIELDGVRFLTDPILRDRIVHLRHRYTPNETAAYQNIDAVLISHLHFDHLDLPSLRMIGHSTRLVVPNGAGNLLRKQGFTNVIEVGVGDSFSIRSVTIEATYALHTPARHPFGPSAECLGFFIKGSYYIYFAGDTDLFPEMATFADALDVAFLPIWGWGPTLGSGHMDPLRAAQALSLLRPRLAVPIHWGTLHPWGLGWLKPDFLTRPPHEFVRHAADIAPEVETQIVTPGTAFLLPNFLGDAPSY